MERRFAWPARERREHLTGTRFALAAVGPPGTVAVLESGPIRAALQGHPSWIGGSTTEVRVEEVGRRLTAAWLHRGTAALESLRGDFALAILDGRSDEVTLAIDRIGVRNIVYQQTRGAFVFGASSDVVSAHPLVERSLSAQAIYDYAYFHMVPGPDTAFREQSRLLAGHFLVARDGRVTTRSYWQMRFTEPARGSVSALRPAFRAALSDGVSAFAGGDRCGTFLSGGTDSSTVSGMLGLVTGKPAQTYSIGFEAAGYDEMEFARIASRHFGTSHHEYYVTPDDVLRAVPLIAAAYDQPFGNASAVPTYYCAKFARSDGIGRMLGGDGATSCLAATRAMPSSTSSRSTSAYRRRCAGA
jgi:asparagine synthase (glutamine-hydrolysing)